ncbi:MAG: Hsp70 family protein [Cetobacterium sp.]
MNNNSKKLYYGIDLGTTNSAIAYGFLGGNGNFETKVCPVSRFGKDGGQEAKETLPSVVYYKKDVKKGKIESIVGDFAKNQYAKKYGYVMKSVKNHMGSLEPLPLEKDIEDRIPEEISAKILKHLASGLKNKLTLNEDLKNVIITIPASFDPDMCKATLKAAELAGFDVKLKSGEYKNILLYEPKAVIYNIANMIINGDIPKNTIDFSTKKNVLVFDLGGGTLDVALYSVESSKEDQFPIVDEVAIGRYTAIGGDTFDSILAEELTNKFLEFNGITQNDVNLKEVKQIMENKAEYLKLELSDKIFNAKYAGNNVSGNEEFEIIEMDLYKGYEFEAYMTKNEIEKVLSPIMGDNLKESDVKNIDNLKGKDIENIIYPILDVLSKAVEKNGSYNVEAVILNGGMTKFYLIQDRIEKFFGVKPIVVNDPDLSVAKGAAFYQYCLEKRNIMDKAIDISVKDKIVSNIHKNKVVINSFENLKEVVEKKDNENIKEIKESFIDIGTVVLNETINLALEKGYVHPLVKAGMDLPTGDIEFKDIFYIPKALNCFELPFYMGRGKTTEAPNRKIASRIITLRNTYPINTKVTLIVNIDKSKNLTLTGYVGENRNEIIDITIDTFKDNKINKTGLTKIATNLSKNLDPKREIEFIKTTIKKLSLNKSSKEECYRILENIKNQISLCSNKSSFEKYILESLGVFENSDYAKGYLFSLGQIIYEEMKDLGKIEFVRYLKNMLTNKFVLENDKNSSNIKIAIKNIGLIGDTASLGLLEKLLEETKDLFFNEIIQSLGKLSKENEKIYNVFINTHSEHVKMNSLLKSIGDSYANWGEKSNENMGKILNKLLKISLEECNNNSLLAIVALGKVIDTRFEKNKNFSDNVIENTIEKLDKKYKYMNSSSEFKNIYDVALNLMKGLPLTSEELKILENI